MRLLTEALHTVFSIPRKPANILVTDTDFPDFSLSLIANSTTLQGKGTPL